MRFGYARGQCVEAIRSALRDVQCTGGYSAALEDITGFVREVTHIMIVPPHTYHDTLSHKS